MINVLTRLLLVCSLAILSACSNPPNTLHDLRRDLESCSNISVAFVGDSITWGAFASGLSVTGPRAHSLTDPRNNFDSGTWVNLLIWHIRDKYGGELVSESAGRQVYKYCKGSRIVFSNNGLIGTRSDQWMPGQGRLEAATSGHQYVFLLVGVNDRALPTGNEGKTLANIKSILSSLKGEGKQVVLQTYLPVAPSADYPAKKRLYFASEQVNKAIRAAGSSEGIFIVDNNKEASTIKFDSSKYLLDGLHPSDLGHRFMFGNIISQM